MNIFINVNDNYLPYAAVMLLSLRTNNKNTDIRVYLLHAGISSVRLIEFRKYLNSIKIDLYCLKVPLEIIKGFPNTGRWTKETYFRLMLPDVLDQSIEKGLYLDVDIIVNGPITELYEMNITDKCLAAGADEVEMSSHEGEHHNLAFNAGVMLINLKKMRKTHSFDLIREKLINEPESYPMLDQDILNELYRSEVLYFDSSKYNKQVSCVEISDEKTAVILHYSLQPKPWDARGSNYYRKIWLDYAKDCEYFILSKKGDQL